ncbi:MAG: murein L,D-transpeptidase catalytic domain family protein [Chitinispirillaceae bacterium]|nr:murein L,D-transpeptidase catalytic domain family protein [Chitinispirillaceae bacterium]
MILKTTILLLTFAQILCSNDPSNKVNATDTLFTKFINDIETVRTEHFPEINKNAFRQCIVGYSNGIHRNSIKKKNIVTLIDYSKSSNEKRLYVLDVTQMRILHASLVAHGRNSGNEFAHSFSNKNESKMSCPGFFTTMKPYTGKHGYSLKLKGLEKNINDNAFKRAIVIHGADYVSPEFIKKNGRLGRSWGCPALPLSLNRTIIDTIKEGTLLYIHTVNDHEVPASDLRTVGKKTVSTFYSLFGDSL